MTCDVLVVGGGVAGLAAAGRLSAAGLKVTLLEARERLGGRIHTVIDPTSGLPIELGAEFIQGERTNVMQIVRRRGLEVHELPEWHEHREHGIAAPVPGMHELLDRLLAASGGQDVTAAELIRRAEVAGLSADQAEEVSSYIEGFHAAELTRAGSLGLAENQAAEVEDGERLFRLAGGYGGLVTELAQAVDQSLVEVHTGVVVTDLRWRRHEVRAEVRTDEDASAEYAGRQTILTVPLSVLKAPPGSEGSVRFDPEPSGWREAFGSLEMGSAHRVVLVFDTAWWMERSRPGPTFIHGEDEAFPVWWNASPAEIPLLTGWAGGPRGAALAGLPHDQIVELAVSSAATIFGRSVESLGQQLRAAYSHDWSTDPFARGGYSYGGIGALTARKVLIRPVENTLFLAGEAVALEGRNATVHGAIASGLRAADDLLSDKLASSRR
jgi:monoamine oxidase